MFEVGKVIAYPTDTSFGLGVLVRDEAGLDALNEMKQRPEGKWFSVMVKDWEMLEDYAEVPEDLPRDFFEEKPRTVVLRPKSTFPIHKYLPRGGGVAFRVCVRDDIARHIIEPVTATSANISGGEACFCADDIRNIWGDRVGFLGEDIVLKPAEASEIWDYRTLEKIRLR